MRNPCAYRDELDSFRMAGCFTSQREEIMQGHPS